MNPPPPSVQISVLRTVIHKKGWEQLGRESTTWAWSFRCPGNQGSAPRVIGMCQRNTGAGVVGGGRTQKLSFNRCRFQFFKMKRDSGYGITTVWLSLMPPKYTLSMVKTVSRKNVSSPLLGVCWRPVNSTDKRQISKRKARFYSYIQMGVHKEMWPKERIWGLCAI